MPCRTGSSYSSRSSIVGALASMSARVAKRWTLIFERSPYGIGCLIRATRKPASVRIRPTRRVVGDLPAPVRVATTATTGHGLGSIDAWVTAGGTPAPAARTRDARCITSV